MLTRQPRGQAEISELDASALAIEENALRLQVEMDHAASMNPVQDVDQRQGQRKEHLQRARCRSQRGQQLTPHILLDRYQRAAVFQQRHRAHHPRTAQLRQEFVIAP